MNRVSTRGSGLEIEIVRVASLSNLECNARQTTANETPDVKVIMIVGVEW